VLVDTSVWSLALRRRAGTLSPSERDHVATLGRLIDEHRVLMIGPVRQELLSGVRHPEQFARLRERLRAFPDEVLTAEDYETAAAMGNRCRGKGLAVSTVDLLLCAATIQRAAALFTTDEDFTRYAEVLPLDLLTP
jgi:predicted nucleic acid-binding protein